MRIIKFPVNRFLVIFVLSLSLFPICGRCTDSEDPAVQQGLSVVRATAPGQAFNISIQATPAIIRPSLSFDENKAILQMAVTDKDGLPVNGTPIIMSLMNSTGGGEYITPALVYSDASGQATSEFYAGQLYSGSDGVICVARLLTGPQTGSRTDEFSFDGVAQTITAATVDFTDLNNDGDTTSDDTFQPGDQIMVTGSGINDWVYRIADSGVAPGTLTLVDDTGIPDDQLTTQAASNAYTIDIEKVAATTVVIDGHHLINWNGNLVADFGDRGLWYHDGTSWNWLTNVVHSSMPLPMAVWDGKLVVNFGAGKGLWYYDTSWHWMTNRNDVKLMQPWDNGTTEVLAVNFGGYPAGIYTYDGSWHWLSNKDYLNGMTVWNNKLVVDFGSPFNRSVYYYDDSWQWMTNKDDVNLMQSWDNGTTEVLVVDFRDGRGIYTFNGSWNWLSNKDDVNNMTVWDGKLVVDFGAGRGLYTYDGTWSWLSNKDTVACMVPWHNGADLAVDFGFGRNMYNYDGAWHWIKNANNVPEMISLTDRLAVDFGSGVGIYNYNSTWNQIKAWSITD